MIFRFSSVEFSRIHEITKLPHPEETRSRSGKFVSIVPNMGGKHDKESRLLEVPRASAGGVF